ncbi:MAG: metallophosphoesterase family protein [Thermomicrobiales bacterium]
MKIAVISDIHGFSLALDRVLADIASVGVDQVIAAGDLCEGGPDPLGALVMLKDHSISSVQGNTDRDLAAESRTSKPARWVVTQLGPDGLAALDALPFELRITPPGGTSPKDDLLVVHANPVDQDRALDPSAPVQEVEAILGDVQAAVIAFGHIHISYIREVRGITLIDVSAVGNPKDGRLISRWGLLTWDAAESRWLAEIRYVDYPLEETEAQVRASGMPNPDKVLAKLRRASYE